MLPNTVKIASVLGAQIRKVYDGLRRCHLSPRHLILPLIEGAFLLLHEPWSNLIGHFCALMSLKSFLFKGVSSICLFCFKCWGFYKGQVAGIVAMKSRYCMILCFTCIRAKTSDFAAEDDEPARVLSLHYISILEWEMELLPGSGKAVLVALKQTLDQWPYLSSSSKQRAFEDRWKNGFVWWSLDLRDPCLTTNQRNG